MAHEKLFEPIKIGSMELKNRIVMPPMVRNWATEQGEVNDRIINHYRAVAQGGCAMIITEASYIMPNAKGFKYQMGIHDDKLIPGWQKLADVAHAAGAKIGPQIYHAGRQTHSSVTGMPSVAPSPIPCPVEQEMPHELTIPEIEEIEDAYAKAVKRAKRAGCDFAELHGAHGYLITQFLSAYSNKREDKYGGDLKSRMTFVINVVKKCKELAGKDFPIIIRLSAEEKVENGLTLKDTKTIAKKLEHLGVAAIHVSAGNYGTYAQGEMIPPMAMPAGPFIELAAVVNQAVKIPVIAVSKINTPELAEEVIASGKADLVALGRELMADPEWPNKVQNGMVDDINRCISCNQGCIDRLFMQLDCQCVVNPAFGREEEFKIVPAGEPKKVMVVGGGPAGMMAAIVLKQRGHDVAIYEKQEKLGGQMIFAEIPPHREGVTWFKDYLMGQIHKLEIPENLGTEVTPELVSSEAPEVVIVAAGSECSAPGIPGMDLPNVVNPRDVLAGKAEVGKTVLVAGGGCVGAETAEYLAEKGHKVSIVEMKDEIITDIGISDKFLMLQRFKDLGVEIYVKSKITQVTEKGLEIETDGKKQTLAGDNIVVCLGASPNNQLVKNLQGAGPRVIAVGDALEPKRLLEAVYTGYNAALNI